MNTVTIVQTDIGIDDVEEDLLEAGPYRYYFIPFMAMPAIAEHEDAGDMVRVISQTLPLDQAQREDFAATGLILEMLN